jgi:hypothetical protein
MMINRCATFTVVKNNFFSKDFNAIRFLDLRSNKIGTIEANAFQHLTKIMWIELGDNELQSLPHQIFKNNPEITMIWLFGNKINSITPDFFKDLNKLQQVYFGSGNECINKNFGCDYDCSVSQMELDSGLSTCYTNCLNDGECASKSGKLDNLSPGEIERNIDLIISSGHISAIAERNYFDFFIEKSFKKLIIETDSKLKTVDETARNLQILLLESNASLLKAISKNSDEIKNVARKLEETSEDLKELQKSLENNLALLKQSNADNAIKLDRSVDKIQEIEKNTQNLLTVFDDRLNRTVEEVQEKSLKHEENYEKVRLELIANNEANKLLKENSKAELTAHLESTKEEVKDLTTVLQLQISEAKALMENERLQCKLREAEYINDKQAVDFEMKALKQEVAELKAKLEKSTEDTRNLKLELNDIIQKKLDDFVKKLMEDNRP